MSARALPPLALLAALSSCGAPSAPRAQLLVSVDSDLTAPAEIDAVVVRVSAPGRAPVERRFALGPGQRSIPGSFGVSLAEGDVARRVSVEVDARRGDCTLSTYRAQADTRAGEVTPVAVFLARACAGNVAFERCVPRDVCGSPSMTCVRGGGCVAVDRAGAPDAGAPAITPRRSEVPTAGGSIAITPDDTRAVAANRRGNSVTVFDLDLGTARSVRRRETLTPPPVGTGSDPEAWAVVAGNDSDTAFVALRRGQQVMRVDGLKTTPRRFAVTAPTGSEPTGIAITPSGRHLYVANFAEGTLTVVATATMHVEMTVDLNEVLARSGRLGMLQSRPGLAHPRAVVITNDGDDDDTDEVAYVTEFFSQARDPATVTRDGSPLDPAVHPEFWDLARVGMVYRVPLSTNVPDANPIVIGPLGDTGFDDSRGNRTGCFPNQLYAAAISHGQLYVTGICTSPSGPLGQTCLSGACPEAPTEEQVDPRPYHTLSHAAVFTVDLDTNASRARPALMTELFDRVYSQPFGPQRPPPFRGAVLPDDAQRRMPLLPIGLAFVPGDFVSYVLGYGSDAVFRMRFNAMGAVEQVGALDTRYIDLLGPAATEGRLPIGIAIGHDAALGHTHTALVLNANTANVSVVDLNQQRVVAAHPVAPPQSVDAMTQSVRDGRRFFVTGRERWSWRAQAWSSCEGCHPDGLSDGVTWFFPRGPRQTPSLDGSFAPGTRDVPEQRLFGWVASFDEVHDVEGVVRGIEGGVGAIVHHGDALPRLADRIVYGSDRPTGATPTGTATNQTGLNGSLSAMSPAARCTGTCSVVDDLDDLARYVSTIRSPRRPVGLDPTAVAAGRRLFENSCAGCHGSALWTTSRLFYRPSEANNHAATGALRTRSYLLPTGLAPEFNPPARSGSARYRYAGPEAASNDFMQCAVRGVGTVGALIAGRVTGTMAYAPVAPEGVAVREVRQSMGTSMSDLAQGADGFSPPSLIGLGLTAPYFHAGNARTLEELFHRVFSAHHTGFCQNCYDDHTVAGRGEIRNMVAFLLSIDDEQTPMDARLPGLPGIDLCAQGDGLFP